MEFQLVVGARPIELEQVLEIVLAADPASLVDRDPRSGDLRIAAAMDAEQLTQCLEAAGINLQPGQLRQLPSVCCGGCGG